MTIAGNRHPHLGCHLSHRWNDNELPGKSGAIPGHRGPEGLEWWHCVGWSYHQWMTHTWRKGLHPALQHPSHGWYPQWANIEMPHRHTIGIRCPKIIGPITPSEPNPINTQAAPKVVSPHIHSVNQSICVWDTRVAFNKTTAHPRYWTPVEGSF